MAINKQKKQEIVQELTQMVSNAQSLVVADYHNISVNDLNELRVKGRGNKVQVKIAKNTLLKIAIKDSQFENLNDYLKGPILVAFSQEEPSSGARLFKDFSKNNEAFEVVAGVMENQVFDQSNFDALASIPSKQEAVQQIACVLQSVLNQFARTVNEVPSKFVRTVEAYKNTLN